MTASVGSLKVTVIEAKGLSNRDGLFGRKNDAYVTVTVGNRSNTTDVKKDAGSAAVWNQDFVYEIKQESSIKVVCLDYDKFTKDDIIGTAEVPLQAIKEFGFLDSWFPLLHEKKECGQIRIRSTFILLRQDNF